MPALYSHTTRANGTTLTAAIYNADHTNHVTNGVPAMLDDYSATVAEMQTTADPGEVGTESLATSLAEEIARLRHAILETKQAIDASLTRWYQTPASLTRLPTGYLWGLNVGSSGSSTVTITRGAARSQDDTTDLTVTGALTARSVTGPWVSTAAAGGRGFTTTGLSRQVLHVFVFKTQASTVDMGFDNVLTASNLQARASMSKYRRVGSVILTTDAAGVWAQTSREGHVLYTNMNTMLTNVSHYVSFTPATTIAFAKLPMVPTGLNVKAHFGLRRTDYTTNTLQAYILDADISAIQGAGNSFCQVVFPSTPFNSAQEFERWTDINGNIKHFASVAAGLQLQGFTYGYYDPRTG